MKQSLVTVLAGYQSLGYDDSREKPVDRLMAMMNATKRSELASVGKDLIAFKYANRAESRGPAVEGLADALEWPRLRLGLNTSNRFRVAGWAVHEWTIDFCPACQGKAEIPAHVELQEGLEGRQPMVPCGACAGTGKRRYSDQERTAALGDLRLLERGLMEAHCLIGSAERLAVNLAAEILEKWPAKA